MAVGGRGIISVASNEIPAEMVQMVEAAERNDFAAARRIHARLVPLLLINFVEANPIPVKAAMARWACSKRSTGCRWCAAARVEKRSLEF
jgi:4-hydroxy-tetrahydrodipicolinate synthase